MIQTRKQKQEEVAITVALCRLRAQPLNVPIRVEKFVAKHWLLQNTFVRVGDNTFSILIKDIGLGVCEVELAQVRNTQMKK